MSPKPDRSSVKSSREQIQHWPLVLSPADKLICAACQAGDPGQTSSKPAVASVAKRADFRMLAAAPRDGFRLDDFNFPRPQAGALVRTVAKRLAF
jgi:hypothetical protein